MKTSWSWSFHESGRHMQTILAFRFTENENALYERNFKGYLALIV